MAALWGSFGGILGDILPIWLIFLLFSFDIDAGDDKGRYLF
jgi:hypothetical protein